MALDAPNVSVNRGWLYHPTFPEHWTPCALHSMARWVNGIAFKDIQFTPTGRPVIKIAEIKGGLTDQTKFTQQIFDESVRVQSGDLLFSWSGQPETSIDAFWWRGPEGWLNQHVFRVTPEDGINAIFFYNLLRYLKPNFVGIARNKQTTGLGHVTKRDLQNLEVAYPQPPEQRAIAHILGTLDDKIELNRQMSATLEAMAQALFKAWFVDFEPVRAKAQGAVPYLANELWTLFPNALDEQGEPVGWTQGTIADIADSPRRAASPSELAPDTPYIGLEHMPRRSIALSEWESAGKVTSNKSVFKKGEFLFGKLRPYFHKVGFAQVDGICSTDIVVVIPRTPEWGAFTLACISSDRFVDYTDQASTGTKMPRTSWKAMGQYKICIPSARVAHAFQRLLQPVMDQISANIRETRILATLRDTLLPKLVSGELHIEDAETFLDRVL